MNVELVKSEQGDFLIEDTWAIEVGGKNKDSSQLASFPNAYIVADDIETGSESIPPSSSLVS